MNKKQYDAPRSEAFSIKMEGMIATSSLPIRSNPGNEQLSNRNEWSNDIWGNDGNIWK